MNGLSLCSGIAGLDLGLRLAVPDYRTVCWVEIETFPQDVLLARMADGILDRAPIWGDLKQFDGRRWRGLVDLVHGGYPCQPFSVAGKQLGAADPRHLWPDVARVVREVEPEFCFFENVGGHLRLGFDLVASDLVDLGYRVAAGLFTAAEVGAPHRRERLYILARRYPGDDLADAGCIGQHANESGREGGSGWQMAPVSSGGSANVGYTHDKGLEGRSEPVTERTDELPAWPPSPAERARWGRVLSIAGYLAPAVEDATRDWEPRSDGQSGWCQRVPETSPNRNGQEAPQSVVRRVADGAPRRVDRLKALGNGVVPAVAAHAWRTLSSRLIA